jgi:hypothetical protein
LKRRRSRVETPLAVRQFVLGQFNRGQTHGDFLFGEQDIVEPQRTSVAVSASTVWCGQRLFPQQPGRPQRGPHPATSKMDCTRRTPVDQFSAQDQ